MASLEDIFRNVSPSTPEKTVGFCLWRVTLAYQRQVEVELKPLKLTHLQYVVLALSAWLNYTKGETSQRDVAVMTGVQEAQVSLMVKALKAKRLLRQSTGADSRVRLVSLTASGLKTLQAAMPKMLSLQQEYWPAGMETEELLQLLEHTRHRQTSGLVQSPNPDSGSNKNQ